MFVLHRYLLTAALVGALLLAVARPSSGAQPEERYVVKPGDTLWSLAEQRYSGDPREGVWRISRRNGLGRASLQPGMILYLPASRGDA